MTDLGEPDLFPEQEEPEVRQKRPVTVRRAAIVSARVVTGLVGIGVAVVAVAASSLLPLPTFRAVPASELVTPVATAQQLVCPGAVLRLSDDTGQSATTASALGRPNLDYFASSGGADAAPLAQSDAGTAGTSAAPTVVSSPPTPADPSQRVLLSGAQSQSVAEGDFVGLAVADCAGASSDSWLVGGSTTVGRTTLLTLSNPTDVAATVDLELFGERGPIAAPGTSGIIVAPLGQRVLSLAGFQPDVVSPVVHVSSAGGQVVANLQQVVVRGLEPGGLDIVEPTSALSIENVIPGLVVTDLAATQALLGGGNSFEDVKTVLRLFGPGEGTIAVTVNVIPEDGADTGTSFDLELEAGRVTDVPIEELSTGSYTVRVESAAPIVAAARVTSAVAVTDFSWASPAPALLDRAQVTIAPGPTPALHLSNPATTDATVAIGDLTVTVPGGASAVVPVEPGETYELSGFDRLYAAVSYAADGLIARHTVHPPGAASGAITVYP